MLLAILAMLMLSLGCGETKTPKTSAVEDYSQIELWQLTPSRQEQVEELIATPSISGLIKIPFALLDSEEITGSVEYDSELNISRLKLNNGKQLYLPGSGIPVALEQVDSFHYAIIFRSIPDNSLLIFDWDTKKDSVSMTPLERAGVEYLMYRASLVHEKDLYLVLYDNRTRINYLRQYSHASGSWQPVSAEVPLPHLGGSHGITYEMEPPVSLFFEEEGIRVIGGNLSILVNSEGIYFNRNPECERILEAIQTPDGVAMLCNRKSQDENGAYVIIKQNDVNNIVIAPQEGVPWKLNWNSEKKNLEYQLAKSSQEYAQLIAYDFIRAQNSGMLEFGSNNVEGRVPWAQIYYLNGLMDAIYLAKRDDIAFDIFQPLLKDLRLRLELEIRLLDNLIQEPFGMHTRGFTVDRSLALFAVQTGRYLLLMERYQQEFPDAMPLNSLEYLRNKVANLDGHIEVLSDSGEEERWLPAGQRHLRWPKGSAFYFDGLAVPYNHQNEWAYSLFESNKIQGVTCGDPKLEPQIEIIRHFIRHVAPKGVFPKPENWNYWWGHAYDGYSKDSGMSINKPDYQGQQGLAYISFRSIDMMSVLSSLRFISDLDKSGLLSTAMERVKEGEVYPFAARSLIENGNTPELKRMVALKYSRVGAPWELANQPWALTMLKHSEVILQRSDQ